MRHANSWQNHLEGPNQDIKERAVLGKSTEDLFKEADLVCGVEVTERLRLFGFHAMVVDGHDVEALLAAFDEAAATKGKPSILLCKTFKGKDFGPDIALSQGKRLKQARLGWVG